MPYSIRLPDGTLVNNIPDDLNPLDAKRRIIAAYPQFAPETTILGQAGEAIKGLVPGAIGLIETGVAGASALLPEEYEEAVRAKTKEIATAAKKPFEASIGYEDTVGRKLGEAIGSTIPFLAAGPFGLAGRAAAVGLGTAAGAGEARTRAEAEGATAEQRSAATGYGIIPGAAEAFAPLRILGRLGDDIVGGGVAYVKRALVAGGEEAAQEAASGFAQNLIAKGIYKPEQELIEGLGEQAAYGGATGAIVQGLLDLAIGRRARGPEATAEPTAEAPPAPPVVTNYQTIDQAGNPATISVSQDNTGTIVATGPDGEPVDLSNMVSAGFTVEDSIKSVFSAPEAPVVPAAPEAAPAPRVEPEITLPSAPEITPPIPPVSEAAPQREIGPTFAEEAPFEGAEMRAVEQPPMPLSEEITALDKDAERVVKDIKRAERQRKGESLAGALKNKLNDSELYDIFGTEAPSYFKSGKKSGEGKTIADAIADGDIDAFIPDEFIVNSGDSPETVMDKQMATVDRIKDKLRNKNYLTASTESELQRLNFDLKGIEDSLALEMTDDQIRQEANALAAEIAAEQGLSPVEETFEEGPVGDTGERPATTRIESAARRGQTAEEKAIADRERGLFALQPQVSEKVGAPTGDLFGAEGAQQIRPSAPKPSRVPEGQLNLFNSDKDFVENSSSAVSGKSENIAEAQRVEKALKGKTPIQAAKWMAANATNPDFRLIAKRVVDRMQKLMDAGIPFKLHIVGVGDKVPVRLLSADGLTSSLTNRSEKKVVSVDIWLNNSTVTGRVGTEEKIVLHELIHAVTAGANFLGNLKSMQGTEAAKLFTRLYDVRNAVVRHFNSRVKSVPSDQLTALEKKVYIDGANALKDEDEVLAWGLTDPDMQEYLESIPYKGQTAWNAFVDAIREFLGLPKAKETALSEVLAISDLLFEAPLVEAGQAEAAKPTTLRVDSIGSRDTIFKQVSPESRRNKNAIPLKNPIHLEDGSRLSGVTDNAGTTFYGYDKNGEQFTIPVNSIDPNNIKWSRDNNRTAEEIKQKLSPKKEASKPAQPIANQDQISLFNASVRGQKVKMTPTAEGQAALDTINDLGRQVEETPTMTQKVREYWDNATDNPQATKEAAKKATVRFLDKIETYVFNSDAALNNSIQRLIKDTTMSEQEKMGILLSISSSQAVHADALANLFIRYGGLNYDPSIYKYVAVDKKDNFVSLVQGIDTIGAKYGLTKQQAERVSHTAFEAKRLNSIARFNRALKVEIDDLRDMARTASDPTARDLASKEVRRKVKDFKFVHMTDEQIQRGLDLFKTIPELNALVDTWNGIRENSRKEMVESSLWSEEESDGLLSNMDYVPFYREDQLEKGKGPKEFLRNLQVQAKEKKLKGSDKPVADIFDNMARWTQYAVKRSVMNRLALAKIDAAVEMGIAKKVEKQKQGDNSVRVWRDGNAEYYSLDDPLFMEAFTGLESVAIPSLKYFAKLSNLLRKSVVLYPLFSISQVPQDAFAAMFSSGLKTRFALTIPARAAKEFIKTIFKSSQTHKELERIGVVGIRDFTAQIAREDAEIYAGLKARPGVVNKVKNFLEHISMASDNAVRQAVYEASIAQGVSRKEAIEKAFNIINFRNRGSSKELAAMGQVIPFFNAYLAAQHVAYRTISGVGISPTERKAALGTLAATTASVMTLSLIYAMLVGDDEDYLNKPSVMRDRLFIIPGTGVTIPIRSDIFSIPKIITEHMYMLMTDNGASDGRKFRDSMKAALGNAFFSPTVFPQAIKPVFEVGINYNFFQGRPLVGTYQQGLETARQFNDSTSELAKAIGQTGLISPIAVDHLMRGMLGSAGGLMLYMTNFALHNDPSVPRPAMSIREAAAALPGTSGFLTKEYETALKNDFYVLRDEVSTAVNTLNDLKKRSPHEIEEFLADETNLTRVGMAKVVNRITKNLTDIRRSISQITASDQMSASEKAEQIRELKAIEREILQNVDLKSLREMANL